MRLAGKFRADADTYGRAWAPPLTFDQIHILTGKTIGQFLILAALLVTTTAVSDDLIDIVRRDIAAADIAEIIAFTVKWADDLISHDDLLCKTERFDYLHGEKARSTGSSSRGYLIPCVGKHLQTKK